MSSHVTLPGSHREHPAGSEAVGKPGPNDILNVTLVLRRRQAVSHAHSIDRDLSHHLSHQDLALNHGADPADIEAVEAFASGHGLSVVNVNPASRSITISGTVAAFVRGVRCGR